MDFEEQNIIVVVQEIMLNILKVFLRKEAQLQHNINWYIIDLAIKISKKAIYKDVTNEELDCKFFSN